MNQFIYQNGSQGRGLWLAVTAALLLLSNTTVWAQRGVPRQGPPGQQASQEVDDAADQVRLLAVQVLEQVARNQPLSPTDVAEIEELLKNPNRFKGMFKKDDKVKLLLVEAYLAHYSGQGRDVTLDFINKARYFVKDDPDVNESTIVLGLYYEDYPLVKSVLGKLGPTGSATPDGLPDDQERPDPNASVPGLFGSTPDSPQDAPGQSKWGLQTRSGTRNRSGQDRGRDIAIGPPVPGVTIGDPTYVQHGGMPESGRTRSRPRGSRTSKASRPAESVLNLPVTHMPYEHLGEDFGQVLVRNVNGSYFQFVGGQGRLLCALLWALPADSGQDNRQGGPDYRGGFDPMAAPGPMPSPSRSNSRRGRSTSQQSRAADGSVPEVAYDLATNARQFSELFSAGVLSGKIDFLSVNLNGPAYMGHVVRFLMNKAWPWSNCLAEGPDPTSWQLDTPVQPVMVLVDVKGKIRYMGPVGGFLPRMLLDVEMPKATASAAGSFSMPDQSQQATGELMGILGALLGAGSDQQGASGRTDGGSGALGQVTAQPKQSEPQAQQMLEAATVQRKTSLGFGTPRRALRTCDEVLERYPDSIEADRAKRMIEEMISGNSVLVKERQRLGKYTGQ